MAASVSCSLVTDVSVSPCPPAGMADVSQMSMPCVSAEPRLEVPVRGRAHRVQARAPQALGEERVAGEVGVEVAAVAQRLARVLADEHRPDALPVYEAIA